MGVVVSAVASGIVQNVQADLVKAQEQQEGKKGKEEEDVVQGRLEEGRGGGGGGGGESPGRIETPGYPPVLLSPPPATTFTDLKPSQEVRHTQGKDLTEKIMPEEKGEKEVEEVEEQEEQDVVTEVEVVSCKSPSFLENIFSSLRLTSPSQPPPLSLQLPEPGVGLEPGEQPGEQPGEKKVVVEPVGFFPASSLPVVSLLPTLTEEITISLSQSQTCNAGWFRRNYTSIDTVQRIYGTHPRYGHRRPGGGLARPRR